MKKFEYINLQTSPDKMNQLGQEGWELVAVCGSIGYFKREIEGRTPSESVEKSTIGDEK